MRKTIDIDNYRFDNSLIEDIVKYRYSNKIIKLIKAKNGKEAYFKYVRVWGDIG